MSTATPPKGPSSRWTRSAATWFARGIVAATLIFGAVASPGAEELPVVPAPTVPFRNVDEAIGWTKARGMCVVSTCVLLVRVAAQSSTGKPISPGWQLDAHVSVTDISSSSVEFRTFSVTIRRQRTFNLSASDPTATLSTMKLSAYEFGSDGFLLERSGGLIVRTATGDELFSAAFPAPKHGGEVVDSLDNFDILYHQLGIQWKLIK
jgi:hypothetical protein